MSFVSGLNRVGGLRRGDRINYRGIEWLIADYNTYDDPYGYKTEEWMLKSCVVLLLHLYG